MNRQFRCTSSECVYAYEKRIAASSCIVLASRHGKHDSYCVGNYTQAQYSRRKLHQSVNGSSAAFTALLPCT